MPDPFAEFRKSSSPESADPFSQFRDAPAPQPEEESGPNMGAIAAVGGGAALLTALVLHNPQMAKSMAVTALKKANAARQQLMLSHLALPKSVLGNVGAVATDAIESRSLTPLKKFFSGETLRDAASAFRNAREVGPVNSQSGTTLPFPFDLPGRTMGALDTATQKAMQRYGKTGEEAAASLFQAPLGENFGNMSKVLESPIAKYTIPFRRTPFNQFYEGMKTMSPEYAHKGVTAGYAAAGAVHGAATSDEQYPVSIPLATAASAKYGMPYALGALAGRVYSGGKNSAGIAGSVLPVSEYGVERSITDPFAPFRVTE